MADNNPKHPLDVEYFVSFTFKKPGHSNGFGNVTVTMSSPVTSQADIIEMTKWISELPEVQSDADQLVILNFVRLPA